MAGVDRPAVTALADARTAWWLHEGRQAVEAVWRIESARIVGALARYTGDFAMAEDLAQEALAEALVSWPRDGVPRNPAGWLLTVGRRRAIDAFRRRSALDERYAALAADLDEGQATSGSAPEHGEEDDVLYDPERIDDDVLALIFISCHPVLSREASVALTLRVLGGLTSDEIARAFVTPTATVQARITRAKKTLAAAQVPFEVPPLDERRQRLELGAQRRLPDLHRGLERHLGQRVDPHRPGPRGDPPGPVLARLMPDEPETPGPARPPRAHRRPLPGAASAPTARPCCSRTRTVAAGTAPPSAAAARRWSRPAGSVAGSARTGSRPPSPSATRSRRPSRRPTGSGSSCCTTPSRSLAPSPIVDLNRAVAVSMARGPDAALPLVDGLVESGRPRRLTPAARRPRRAAHPARADRRGSGGAGDRRTAVRERAGARGPPGEAREPV